MHTEAVWAAIILIFLTAVNGSNLNYSCNFVDDPMISGRTGPTSWTVEWDDVFPIDICMRESGLDFNSSFQFICENNNVIYQHFNYSDSCNVNELTFTTKANSSHHYCNASIPCSYTQVKLYQPDYFNETICSHYNLYQDWLVVTDYCKRDGGLSVKMTCIESNNTAILQQFNGTNCDDKRLIFSDTIVNGCNKQGRLKRDSYYIGVDCVNTKKTQPVHKKLFYN